MMTLSFPTYWRGAMAAVLAAAAISSSAQQLNKEITVDHDIVPEKREAVKLGFTPVVTLTPLKLPSLTPTWSGVGVKATPTAATLAPAAMEAAMADTTSRGYASLGYGPTYNVAASLGFRLIATRSTRMNAWAQFDGATWRPGDCRWIGRPVGSRTLGRNTLTAALAMTTATSARSTLDLGVTYIHDRLKSPLDFAEPVTLAWRHVNRLGVNAAWHNAGATVPFGVRASWGLFRNSDHFARTVGATLLRPVTENHFTVGGDFGWLAGEKSRIGLDANVSVVANSRGNAVERLDALDAMVNYRPTDLGDSYSHGLLTLTPAYVYGSRNFTARVGARVDFSFNAGKAFHIAPDVMLGWNPLQQLAVTLAAGGGEHQNTLARLSEANPWAANWLSYGNSHIPLTFDGKIVIGPFGGVALELTAAYARANSWLMPVAAGGYSVLSRSGFVDMPSFAVLDATTSLFAPVDMRGWKFGAALTFSSQRWGFVKLACERTTGHSYTGGWYEWLDRARQTVTASALFTPVKSLAFNADFSLRTGRRLLDELVDLSDPAHIVASRREISLSTACTLAVGASWNFRPGMSVFLRGENLLDRHFRDIAALPTQGIRGLVGINLKF